MGTGRPASAGAGQQKEKAKQRIRALDLIQKFCGPNAREAQKTKWIVDLVVKVDDQYKQDMTLQQQQIVDLQQQLAELQDQSSSTIQQLQSRVDSLQATVRDQKIALASSSYALETAEVQYHSMQESLRCAEAAAAVAASECDALVRIVHNLIDQESRVRSAQAHRAHELREALQQTHAALRRAADKDRGAQDEREIRLRKREQSLTAERAALLEQQSIHAARDEALETLQLKYHLSVCKIKDLLRSASEQADSAAAAVASGNSHLGDRPAATLHHSSADGHAPGAGTHSPTKQPQQHA